MTNPQPSFRPGGFPANRMELPMIVKHNPGAVAIAGPAYKTRVVKPRKGRGAYSRKGRNR